MPTKDSCRVSKTQPLNVFEYSFLPRSGKSGALEREILDVTSRSKLCNDSVIMWLPTGITEGLAYQ